MKKLIQALQGEAKRLEATYNHGPCRDIAVSLRRIAKALEPIRRGRTCQVISDEMEEALAADGARPAEGADCDDIRNDFAANYGAKHALVIEYDRADKAGRII